MPDLNSWQDDNVSESRLESKPKYLKKLGSEVGQNGTKWDEKPEKPGSVKDIMSCFSNEFGGFVPLSLLVRRALFANASRTLKT